jgi:hypothetical protein
MKIPEKGETYERTSSNSGKTSRYCILTMADNNATVVYQNVETLEIYTRPMAQWAERGYKVVNDLPTSQIIGQAANGRWYINSTINGSGPNGGTLWPERQFDSKEIAVTVSEMVFEGFIKGRKDKEIEFQKVLGIYR